MNCPHLGRCTMDGCTGDCAMPSGYKAVDKDGTTVFTFVRLNVEEPVTCCICERPTWSHLCVPYYCGAVRDGASQGGHNTACEPCYRRWLAWNDALEVIRPFPAAKWRPAHGGYSEPR